MLSNNSLTRHNRSPHGIGTLDIPHFIKEETEAQRGEVPRAKSQSQG